MRTHLKVEKSVQPMREFGVMYSPPHFLLFFKTTRQGPRNCWESVRAVYIIVYKMEDPQPRATPQNAYNLHNSKKAPKIPQKTQKWPKKRRAAPRSAPPKTPRDSAVFLGFLIKKAKKQKKGPINPAPKLCKL